MKAMKPRSVKTKEYIKHNKRSPLYIKKRLLSPIPVFPEKQKHPNIHRNEPQPPTSAVTDDDAGREKKKS